MTTITKPPGQLLGADVAEDLMIAHLKRWLPVYLSEIDVQRGLPRQRTATPKSWQVVPKFDNTLEGQLPAMLIVCPGQANKPVKLGDGRYICTYTLGVCALVKGPDQDSANRIAKRYGTAIAACVEQKLGLGDKEGFVEGISWEGDSYDEVPVEMDRTLTSTTVHFNLELKGVLSAYSGPEAPIFGEPEPEPDPSKPLPPWGIIPDESHIHVTITPKGDLDSDD